MKYELTEETKKVGNVTVHRIKAAKNFRDVKAGDLGGWIESERNLGQHGECWVYKNAMVYGDVRVSGSARVCGDTRISGSARIYGDAKIS